MGELTNRVAVSVVVPAFNAEEYIGEALESVFAQTFKDFEVIVVNDGSTDGTERVVQGHRRSLIYLREQRSGPYFCRNRALEVSRGALIALLDADDVWMPRKLERQVEFCQAHPEYGIVTTDVEWFNESGVTKRSLKSVYPIANGLVMEKLLLDNWITNSAVMVRRECFDKVGYFDEEPGIYGADWMMWVRIAAHYPVYFIDEILVRHRKYPASYSSAKPEAQFQNLFKNLEKLRRAVPQLAARPGLIREASYRICVSRGVADLVALELRRAREKLRRAIQNKPYSLKAWSALGASYLPALVLHTIKRSLRCLRAWGSGH